MSDRRQPSRAWLLLLLLALPVLLVSVAVVVTTQVAAPVSPEPAARVVEPAPPLPPRAEVAAATPPAPAPAVRSAKGPEPAAPAPAPDPERLRSNANAAVATCRNCCSAQAQFQASAKSDEDRDGTGEFGTFAEMSGAAAVRGSAAPLNPPVLSGAFRKPDAAGRVRRSGYVFAIYLPGPGGRPVAEQGEAGIAGGMVDPDLAETTWCMYAWPEVYGETGRLTYFTNQCGDVVATDCPRYSGDAGPEPHAAFQPDPRLAYTIVGNVAIGRAGQDGNVWKQVN